VYVSDLRAGGAAVAVAPGPHVCGERIDAVENLLVAGSYRHTKNLLLFDLRNPMKALQYLEIDAKLS
jgi:hypothetical protein